MVDEKMIARIWRSGLDPTRLADYERFETDECLPMFVRQPGFVAVLFARAGPTNATTMSFWDDQKAADDLTDSSSYRELMKKLGASGMLVGVQSNEEVLNVTGGHLPASVEFKGKYVG